MTVRALRRGDKGPQIAFEEVSDRSSAEELRGSEVSTGARRMLASDEYWPEDLVGLRVETVSGRDLGLVVGVISGKAQDRLVVGEAKIEIPMVKELVPNIDLDSGLIEVVDLPGLT